MQHVPEFLRSVEARLRCPAERRPAVIEELRGHLADRVDALVQQGLATPDAERRAVREMGAVWLLALRLSAANASNMTGYPALVGLVLGLIYGGLLALCLLLLNLPWFVGLGVALLGGLAATPLIRLVFGRLEVVQGTAVASAEIRKWNRVESIAAPVCLAAVLATVAYTVMWGHVRTGLPHTGSASLAETLKAIGEAQARDNLETAVRLTVLAVPTAVLITIEALRNRAIKRVRGAQG